MSLANQQAYLMVGKQASISQDWDGIFYGFYIYAIYN